MRIYWSGFWFGQSPDDACREAATSVERGFDAVKMRVDVDDLATSVARFEAIAAELPAPMGIAVEFVGSGTHSAVREFVDAVDAGRVLWVEDPLPLAEPAATRLLAAELAVPVGGGEHCFGTAALDAYVAAAGIGFPIIDLGHCSGPSALRAVPAGWRYRVPGDRRPPRRAARHGRTLPSHRTGNRLRGGARLVGAHHARRVARAPQELTGAQY